VALSEYFQKGKVGKQACQPYHRGPAPCHGNDFRWDTGQEELNGAADVETVAEDMCKEG